MREQQTGCIQANGTEGNGTGKPWEAMVNQKESRRNQEKPVTVPFSEIPGMLEIPFGDPMAQWRRRFDLQRAKQNHNLGKSCLGG